MTAAMERTLTEARPARALRLPGGVLGDGGQLHRTVRLRALTGADEEALSERGIGGSARVTAFLARAIESIDGLDGPVDESVVDAMHLGDRDYLLLRARQAELGDAVHQVRRCPACARKVDVDVAISELPVRELAHPAAAYRVPLASAGGAEALVRLPTGADQRAVEGVAEVNPAAANTTLFARVVLDLDGAPVTETVARGWSPALRAELAAWLDAQAPGPDLLLDLACPHCHADMSYAFDLPGFFLPND